MDEMVLLRFDPVSESDSESKTAPSPSNTSLYFYPFTNFPIIESHVHPRFIILNSGMMLEKHKYALLDSVGDNETIQLLKRVYAAWTEGSLPTNYHKDELYMEKKATVEDDNITLAVRLDKADSGSRGTKRQRHQEGDGSPPAPSQGSRSR